MAVSRHRKYQQLSAWCQITVQKVVYNIQDGIE